MDVFIAEQRGQYQKSILVRLPFFQACYRYYTDNRPIHIPDMRPVGLYISHDLLKQLIEFHQHSTLPVDPGTVALIMRVADFLGDVWALEEFSRQYCIPSRYLLSVNSY